MSTENKSIIFDLGSGKTIMVQVMLVKEKNGKLSIHTKIGKEPANIRETSIYNNNIVEEA